MGESEGKSAGKTAGILASVIAVLTLAGALGKDLYDRYATERDKAEAVRTDRGKALDADRSTLRLISGLGKAVAEQHVPLMGAALLGPKAPPSPGDLGLPVKATLDDLGMADHFQAITSLDGFDAYDRDLNRAVEAKVSVRARMVYQAQELSQESIEALSLLGRLDTAAGASWFGEWSKNWANYRAWMGNDLDAFGLKFDLPETLAPTDAGRLRDFQGLVDAAIDDGRIRK